MAVTLDIGQRDNVHPPDKQTVGARLALAARAMVYGEAGLEFSGPAYRQTTREDGGLRIWFDHAEGLQNRGLPWKALRLQEPTATLFPPPPRCRAGRLSSLHLRVLSQYRSGMPGRALPAPICTTALPYPPRRSWRGFRRRSLVVSPAAGSAASGTT